MVDKRSKKKNFKKKRDCNTDGVCIATVQWYGTVKDGTVVYVIKFLTARFRLKLVIEENRGELKNPEVEVVSLFSLHNCTVLGWPSTSSSLLSYHIHYRILNLNIPDRIIGFKPWVLKSLTLPKLVLVHLAYVVSKVIMSFE